MSWLDNVKITEAENKDLFGKLIYDWSRVYWIKGIGDNGQIKCGPKVKKRQTIKEFVRPL